MESSIFDSYTPTRMPGVRQFDVADELVLISSAPDAGRARTRNARSAKGKSPSDETPVGKEACETSISLDSAERGAPSSSRAMTLNASGRLIWDLCDGKRSLREIAAQLSDDFGVEPSVMLDHVSTAVASLARQAFLTPREGEGASGPATVFTIGIEDKPYFWWQIAILLQSLEDKLPFGWRAFIVVCNNREPISPQLQDILDAYRVQYATAANHANAYRLDIGLDGGHCHGGMNKIEALSAVAQHVDDDEVIFLLDSDMFLFDSLDLDVMPKGCALPYNYHVAQEVFLSSDPGNDGRGIVLQKLLEALGCEREFKPGGVNVFVTGEVAKNPKFIADCFRFAHGLLLLGRAIGANHTWIAEMPCYALALTVNGIDYDLMDTPKLLVSACNEQSIPPGTFYHYYSDPKGNGQGGFYKTAWCKQNHNQTYFLEDDITPHLEEAASDHERYFFELAMAAKDRLNV